MVHRHCGVDGFENKIAIQGAPQMAVDKEAISLSRFHWYYSKCNLPLCHTSQLLRIFRKLYGIFVILRAYGHFFTDFYIKFYEIINLSPFVMLILLQIIRN